MFKLIKKQTANMESKIVFNYCGQQYTVNIKRTKWGLERDNLAQVLREHYDSKTKSYTDEWNFNYLNFLINSITERMRAYNYDEDFIPNDEDEPEEEKFPIEMDLSNLTFKIAPENVIVWNNTDKYTGEADGDFLSKEEALKLAELIINFYMLPQ